MKSEEPKIFSIFFAFFIFCGRGEKLWALFEKVVACLLLSP